MSNSATTSELFGLAVEYDDVDHVMLAAHIVHDAGFTHVEAYTPYPVEGLAQTLGMRRTHIAPLMFTGALLGGTSGYAMQWFANVVHYPWNIGGRPPNSWPAYIPITFELSILGAALFGVLGMFILNGLPRLYHPMFKVDAFTRASRDHFFLCVEATDPQFEISRVMELLQSTHPLALMEVPR